MREARYQLLSVQEVIQSQQSVDLFVVRSDWLLEIGTGDGSRHVKIRNESSVIESSNVRFRFAL